MFEPGPSQESTYTHIKPKELSLLLFVRVLNHSARWRLSLCAHHESTNNDGEAARQEVRLV